MRNPQPPRWTVSQTLAARAYQQANTLGIRPDKDPGKCTTEIDLAPLVILADERTLPGDGSLALVGLAIVALTAGFVGSLIGVALAAVFP